MSFFNRTTTDAVRRPTTAVEDISGDYTIDPTHTRLGFSTRHAMVTTVRGQFTDFSGTAHVDAATRPLDGLADDPDRQHRHRRRRPRRPPALGRLLRRRQQQGDHLLLDQGRARRRRLGHHRRPHDQGRHQAGHHRVRAQRLGADPFGNLRIGFEGSGTINRKDWGLTWNAALETGGVLVSEKIKLEFDISAIQNG